MDFVAGAGESQLELDRRRLANRSALIVKKLDQRTNTRDLHMQYRSRSNAIPLIAIVGYTNAGKSCLVNRITHSQLPSKDELFTSLTAFHRVSLFPAIGVKVMYLDTIGFISNLPHQLFTAFKSTLDEISQAKLIVHVRDISHYESDFQKKNVLSVLQELKLHSPLLDNHIEVWNKVDLLTKKQLKEKLQNEQQKNNSIGDNIVPHLCYHWCWIKYIRNSDTKKITANRKIKNHRYIH